MLDESEGVTHRVKARRAGGAGGGIWPLGAITNGDMPRGEVHDHPWNEERRDAARTFLHERRVGLFEKGQPADPRTDVDSRALAVGFINDQPRVFDREAARRKSEMDEAVGLFDFLFLKHRERIEPLDLTRDTRDVVRGIEMCDRADPAPTLNQAVPGLRGADPERGNEPYARNDDAATRWSRGVLVQGFWARNGKVVKTE